jgi:hypothetical protein
MKQIDIKKLYTNPYFWVCIFLIAIGLALLIPYLLQNKEDKSAKIKLVRSSNIQLWIPDKSYFIGNNINYLGKIYVCVKDHKSNIDFTPDISNSLWSDISAESSWIQNKSYKIGDITSYSGKTYICIKAHDSKNNLNPLNSPDLWKIYIYFNMLDSDNYNTLYPGDLIESINIEYRLIYQNDGKLVLYDKNNVPLWQSSSSLNPSKAVLKTDGSLVLFDKQQKPYWSSNIKGNGSFKLILQDNGDLIIYNKDGKQVEILFTKNVKPLNWKEFTNYIVGDKVTYENTVYECIFNHLSQSNWFPTNTLGIYWKKYTTTPEVVINNKLLSIPGTDTLNVNQYLQSNNKNYSLRFQNDGNIVLSDKDNKLVWASMKFSSSPSILILQGDGNLVAYDTKKNPFWSSGTAGKGLTPYSLLLKDDGNLILYDRNNTLLWTTGIYIIHKQSNKCLDGDGSKLYFNDCIGNNDYQKWDLITGNSGNNLIKHKASGKCLDGNGSNLYFGPCNQNNNFQNFSREDAKPGFYNYRHKETGKCIDGNGSNLYFGPCNKNNDFQNWK